jgi:hypothetical protein
LAVEGRVNRGAGIAVILAIASLLCGLTGCGTAPPRAAAKDTHEAASDWHALLPAPLGSLLTDIKVPLREVLLFREDARGLAEAEEQECYAKSGSPFEFAGRSADDYVLCFFAEHLYRVDAALHLAKASALADFAALCDGWHKALTADERDESRCSGRDGNVEFAARLAVPVDDNDAALTLTVSDVAARELFETRVMERLKNAVAAPDAADSPGATP